MKQNLRTLTALTVLFVGLMSWYLIYEKKLKPKQAESEEKAKEILSMASADVQELQIERMKNAPKEGESLTPDAKPEYEKIVLRKTSNDWNLSEPVKDRADNATITSMVSSLTATKQDRVVEEKASDLTKYQLNAPILKITVKKTGDEKGITVAIGRDTPTGHNSYAQTDNSEKVYRISRSLKTTFDKPLKDLRKKEIVDLTRDDIAEVEVQLPKENFVVKRSEKNKEEWMLARDLIPAENNEWNKTLNTLVDLKVVDFASENADLKKFGLEKPEVKTLLTLSKDKTRVGVWFGRANDKTYAKREDKPNIYEVDKDLLSKINAGAEKYRSRRLANFNRFDTRRIKLERGKEVLDLVKEANWTLPSKPALKLDDAKVDSLLAAIQDGKIQKYLIGASEAVKNQSALTVRLFEKKDKTETEKLSLKFAPTKNHQNEVLRSDLALSFLISEDDFKKIALSENDFIKVDPPKDEKKNEKKEGEKDEKKDVSKKSE